MALERTQPRERLPLAPRELPSLDFVYSVGEPDQDPYTGATWEGRISLNGEEYGVSLRTGWGKENARGDMQLTLKKGENSEKWSIEQYSKALLLYFQRAKLPTLLVPDAKASIDRYLKNPVAELTFKNMLTPERLTLTEADIDMEQSDVDEDYFNSVGSAVNMLAGLTEAIRKAASQDNSEVSPSV